MVETLIILFLFGLLLILIVLPIGISKFLDDAFSN